MAQKTRVAVLFGGRSGEHEISLRSAASVIRNLDRSRFEVVPVAIDKEGRWHLVAASVAERQAQGSALSIPAPGSSDARPVVLPPDPSRGQGKAVFLDVRTGEVAATAEVIFPVLHGPLCEDGTLQGLLELAEVAFVGCGVLASSAGMDKEVSKRLARDVGLPIVPFVTIRSDRWKRSSESDRNRERERIARELGYPVFVKPANMGSSVGVHKVKDAAALDAALADAFRYDSKILVEKGIAAREIELAVLEHRTPGEAPRVSVAGEVTPTHEFYSYEAKYLDDNVAALLIPARISDEQLKQAQKIAREVFEALECEGMARVDLFLDKNSGQFYFNEVNTIPGFTSISMYPKMWEASGISYSPLLSELVDLALERQCRKKSLSREYLAL
jgi:D-alanine-D-alanine ligase